MEGSTQVNDHGWYGSISCCNRQQPNLKGQISTPRSSETLERISMKLGINYVVGMISHANPCGAAETWVVWANTWHIMSFP